jgi:replicative DNA helicase
MSEPWHDEEPQEPRGQFDLATERATLGAMLLATDPAVIDEIAATVTPNQFYAPAHQEIARAIFENRDCEQPTDWVTLTRQFQATRRLNAIGGPGYLSKLADECPSSAIGAWHAQAVRDFAELRNMHDTGTWLAAMGANLGTDPADIPELYDTAIKRLDAARNLIAGETKPFTADLLPAALASAEHPENVAIVPTGFSDLDDVYRGHKPGQLTIVGARPSVGKTILGVDFARHAAIKLGIPTLFASLEMPAGEIMARIIAAQARVDHKRLLWGQCDDNDWNRIARAIGPIAEAPLCIDDTPLQSITYLRQTARALQRGRGLGLIVVDYLQIMDMPKSESRQQAVGENARELKILAEQLEIPIVALAQLNRGPEQRIDKKPMMSDLRESGAIEAHANNVILLHRESLYDAESRRVGEMDVHLAKHRDGATSEIVLAFQGHYARCQSMAADWTPSGNLAQNGNRA